MFRVLKKLYSLLQERLHWGGWRYHFRDQLSLLIHLNKGCYCTGRKDDADPTWAGLTTRPGNPRCCVDRVAAYGRELGDPIPGHRDWLLGHGTSPGWGGGAWAADGGWEIAARSSGAQLHTQPGLQKPIPGEGLDSSLLWRRPWWEAAGCCGPACSPIDFRLSNIYCSNECCRMSSHPAGLWGFESIHSDSLYEFISIWCSLGLSKSKQIIRASNLHHRLDCFLLLIHVLPPSFTHTMDVSFQIFIDWLRK